MRAACALFVVGGGRLYRPVHARPCVNV